MKVDYFEIEESKINKGCMVLIAVTGDGKKFVCSGQYDTPTYLVPYEAAWDTKPR